MSRVADIERFWSKVDMLNPPKSELMHLGGCWTWTGKPRKEDGYGQFRLGNRVVKAHKFGYEHVVGPVPDGLVLDHLCRNRICIRPGHLEPVTIGENTIRGRAAEVNRARHAARTHCSAGHELTPENTRHVNAGGRRCRTCLAEWNRAYRRRKAA